MLGNLKKQLLIVSAAAIWLSTFTGPIMAGRDENIAPFTQTDISTSWNESWVDVEPLLDEQIQRAIRNADIQTHAYRFKIPETDLESFFQWSEDLIESKLPISFTIHNRNTDICISKVSPLYDVELILKKQPTTELDLHGMRCNQALEETKIFIKDLYTKSQEECTIITGRGNHENEDGTRAVLRDAFPKWINSKELAPLVNEVKLNTSGGAYIVSLKKPAVLDLRIVSSEKSPYESVKDTITDLMKKDAYSLLVKRDSETIQSDLFSFLNSNSETPAGNLTPFSWHYHDMAEIRIDIHNKKSQKLEKNRNVNIQKLLKHKISIKKRNLIIEQIDKKIKNELKKNKKQEIDPETSQKFKHQIKHERKQKQKKIDRLKKESFKEHANQKAKYSLLKRDRVKTRAKTQTKTMLSKLVKDRRANSQIVKSGKIKIIPMIRTSNEPQPNVRLVNEFEEVGSTRSYKIELQSLQQIKMTKAERKKAGRASYKAALAARPKAVSTAIQDSKWYKKPVYNPKKKLAPKTKAAAAAKPTPAQKPIAVPAPKPKAVQAPKPKAAPKVKAAKAPKLKAMSTTISTPALQSNTLHPIVRNAMASMSPDQCKAIIENGEIFFESGIDAEPQAYLMAQLKKLPAVEIDRIAKEIIAQKNDDDSTLAIVIEKTKAWISNNKK